MLVLTLSGTFIYLVTLSTISRLVTYLVTCGVARRLVGVAVCVWLLSSIGWTKLATLRSLWPWDWRSTRLSLGDPVSCLCRQSIQRGDGEFEMLFAGVFDLVVADAAERLHEHHHRGDAGAGDFGGVVQRAGGQAVRWCRATSRMASSQRSISAGWKATGSMFQMRDHSTVQRFFAGEALAGLARFAEHGGEDRRRRDRADRAWLRSGRRPR